MVAMTIITKAALAAELSISKARVSQYLKRGMPERSDGKLDREAALSWISESMPGKIGSQKGASRARSITNQRRYLKPSRMVHEPEANPWDICAKLAVMWMLRPHAQIIAWSVLEAGGSLEVAYAAAKIAQSPMLEAAHLVLHELNHPEARNDEATFSKPENWLNSADWPDLAGKVGVSFDRAALEAYLSTRPIWTLKDNEIPKFERPLTVKDVVGSAADL